MFMRNAGLFVILSIFTLALAASGGCGSSRPEAQFKANTTAGEAPLSVGFTDLSTGDIDIWEWDFDSDGVVDSTQPNAMHIYEEAGTYAVSLTVSGPGGSDIEVKEAFIVVAPPHCRADFIADRTSCYGPCLVEFIDLSTGDVVKWEWDLNGDGWIDRFAQNPNYPYSQDGIYSITLTITTSHGCTDTLTIDNYISVSGCST